MKFVTHPQHTRNLGAPIGWDHSKIACGCLSIHDGDTNGARFMESRWQLEGFETVEMMIDGRIGLAVYGQAHPPVSLVVVPSTRDDLQKRLQNAMDMLRQYARAACVEVK